MEEETRGKLIRRVLISKKGEEVGETCDNWTIIWIGTIRGKIGRLADRVEKTKTSIKDQ